MKYILFIIFLIPQIAISQTQAREGNEIVWSHERPLTWSDFKGPINKSNKVQAACVSTQISNKTEVNYAQDSVKVTVVATMIKNKSWKDKTATTDYLLNHEQLHFDIAELYTRKFRKLISETNYTVKNFNSIHTKLFNKVFKELTARQQLYDKQTNHSLNQESQANWNIEIEKELKAYEAWTSTTVWVALQ